MKDGNRGITRRDFVRLVAEDDLIVQVPQERICLEIPIPDYVERSAVGQLVTFEGFLQRGFGAFSIGDVTD